MHHHAIVVLLAVWGLVLASRATATVDGAPAEVTRKIYISAVDAKGAPVTDLTAADITVKEGGKDRPVVSLQPATGPMQIAILVDDNGTGAYQAGVFQFIQKTIGHAQFSISMLSPQALRLVDFTEDVEGLKGALGKLGPRGRVQADGDQLPEAIADSAKALQQRKAERPIILALTIAGGMLHSVEPNNIMKTIRSTGGAERRLRHGGRSGAGVGGRTERIRRPRRRGPDRTDHRSRHGQNRGLAAEPVPAHLHAARRRQDGGSAHRGDVAQRHQAHGTVPHRG